MFLFTLVARVGDLIRELRWWFAQRPKLLRESSRWSSKARFVWVGRPGQREFLVKLES